MGSKLRQSFSGLVGIDTHSKFFSNHICRIKIYSQQVSAFKPAFRFYRKNQLPFVPLALAFACVFKDSFSGRQWTRFFETIGYNCTDLSF